jgi:hypothetical protein
MAKRARKTGRKTRRNGRKTAQTGHKTTRKEADASVTRVARGDAPITKPGAKEAGLACPLPALAKEDLSSADFLSAVGVALDRRDPDAIADTLLQDVIAAAVKLYAAKAVQRGDVAPFRKDDVTATEAVVAACALIRAADLNLFDVAMWFNRASVLS